MLGKEYIAVILVFFAARTCAQPGCHLNQDLRAEIRSYQPIVDQIVQNVINGPRSGVLFNDLADFVDNFGARISGSPELETAIDNVLTREQAASLVTSEHPVLVTHWVRGEESASIVQPRIQKLNVLGLGSSASTPPEGITAEVLVITSFDELQARKDEVPGKIVLFNVPYVSYGQTVPYRNIGANEASKVGAAASLVRSITPFSIDSPHTGDTDFDSDDLRIPAGAITLEDANLIARLVAKGVKVVVNLKLQNTLYPDSLSRNVIGDITGATKPDEYVVISGHIDSWDVGQGAIDDAGGAFLAWHSLALINELGLPRPARTMRSILWTAEEPGLFGAQAYLKEREDEVRRWSVAFESDGGIWPTLGISFQGSDEAACIMQEITSLLGGANGTQLNHGNGVGSDISYFGDIGIPLGEPYMVQNNYFWYHHSKGDWVEVMRSEDFDQNLAIFASATYILANLSIQLPRTPVPPPSALPHLQEITAQSSAGMLHFHWATLLLMAVTGKIMSR